MAAEITVVETKAVERLLQSNLPSEPTIETVNKGHKSFRVVPLLIEKENKT